MKCCTKLETAKERCPIVFQGHPSNFKVTGYKTSPILTQIGRFRTIGRSQLSNPSDLPCSRSSVKFQGHIALKIVEFDSNWAFADCNSSLNSPMAMKCCTKLETAKKRCPIVLQGNPSNFKVTRDKTSPIFTQIGRFRTIGRSQLSNPSDLPCYLTIPLFMMTWTFFFFSFFFLNLISQSGCVAKCGTSHVLHDDSYRHPCSLYFVLRNLASDLSYMYPRLYFQIGLHAWFYHNGDIYGGEIGNMVFLL